MRWALLAAGVLAFAGAAGGCAAGGQAGEAPATAPATAPVASPAEPAPGRSAGFVIVADAPTGTASAATRPGGVVAVGLRLASSAGSSRTFVLRSSVPWLSVPARVTVPPRQSVAIAATARVGADAAPGVIRAAVSASPRARADAAVAVVYESRVPVAVRVVAP